jgi:hypothetical protein
MKATYGNSLNFRDLSIDECMSTCGGSSFAYDFGRVLRFLGIAAGGVYGPTYAISDWIATSFLEE